MVKYPDINDDNFYDKINKIYSDYKVKKGNKTLNEICNPKDYRLQLPQQFMSDFINPKTPYTGALVYHRIGAGKTCTAIRIAEQWKKYKHIIVVVPASLKGNFRTELRSLCADNNYLTEKERKELLNLHPRDKKYKEIMNKSDERINEYYKIYSYNKFVEMVSGKKPSGEKIVGRPLNLKNSLLIIDEVQNMVSEDGSFYKELHKVIHDSPKDLRIVLLSATPMFDKPKEIALTLNLLRLPKDLPIGRDFDKTFITTTKRSDGSYTHNVKNMDLFKSRIKGFVSFFRGAPPIAFPKMNIKYVKCEMSAFQYSAYIKVLGKEKNGERKNLSRNLDVSDLPNDFYIGTRVISNVVFPNKEINDNGFKSFTAKKITNDLQKYSCKFFEIMNRIQKCSGKIFVYSSFKEYGGIKSFIKVLEAYGYKDYMKNGEGLKRFAVWTGDEHVHVKEEIKAVFNTKKNLKGNHLKIMLGSPSIREGVSLTAVRQVHIIEPYWNRSRLDQVIGRASRFCSHKDLDDEKRNVKVYIYVATAPNYENDVTVPETIDQYIQQLAVGKDKLIKIFERSIKEAAVDCSLNKNANVYEGEENIICEK